MAASAALTTLSAAITDAQDLARQAQALASAAMTSATKLRTAYELSYHARSLGANTAQVDQLEINGLQAASLMDEANTMARHAWSRAAADFASVTALAPSVRAAVNHAQAQARTMAEHDFGILEGIGNLLGAAALPIFGIALDVVSDGSAAAVTSEEVAAEEELVSSGMADLGGGRASVAEIDAAEETAAEDTTIAGSRLDRQIVQDIGDKASTGRFELSTDESWGSPNSLQDHFNRHGPDFGSTSPDEYASQASKFLQEGLQGRFDTKIDSNGVIRIYDPQSNTFGVYNPAGTTRSFFKPSSGLTYWAKQPGSSPWEP